MTGAIYWRCQQLWITFKGEKWLWYRKFQSNRVYARTETGVDRGSIITGSSVYNCHVERSHRDIYSGVLCFLARTLSCLEDNELLDPLNELHLFAYITPSSSESISAYRNLRVSGKIIHHLLKKNWINNITETRVVKYHIASHATCHTKHATVFYMVEQPNPISTQLCFQTPLWYSPRKWKG